LSDPTKKKIDYKQYVVDSQLRYFKPHATKIEKSFAEEISFSLNQKFSKFYKISKIFFMTEKVQIYLNLFVYFLNTILLGLKLVF